MKKTLNGWLIVKSKKETVSKGGVVLPGTYSDRLVEALVVRGCEAGENNPEVLEGTKVLYDSLGGTLEYEMDGEKYDIIRVASLFGEL